MRCWIQSTTRCCRWLLLMPHPLQDCAQRLKSRSADGGIHCSAAHDAGIYLLFAAKL